MQEVKEYIAELHKLWAEFRAEVDAARGASEEKIGALNSRMDELEALIRKPAETAQTPAAETKEFVAKLRAIGTGKAWVSQNDPAAGYLLAPPEFLNELIRQSAELFPMRNLARVRTTSRESVSVRKLVGFSTAYWVSDGATRTETTRQTASADLVIAHELAAYADVGKAELEDAAFNLEAELRQSFAEGFALSEGTAFTSGNGVGKPEGYVTASGNVVTGAAGNFTVDHLIDAYLSLKEPYKVNATWTLNRSTLAKIRKFKDSSGQFIWAPAGGGVVSGNSVIPGLPATILDRPYVINPHMDNSGASGRRPVAIGDFRAYLVVDRLELQVQVDPFSNAINGMTRFWARRRVGGAVLLPEAFAVIQEA